MSRMNFITDVDGVLLDFNKAALDVFKRQFNLPDIEQPKHWSFEHALGIPKNRVSEMWKEVWNNPAFAYPGALSFLVNLRKFPLNLHGLSSRSTGAAQIGSLRDLKREDLFPFLDTMSFTQPHEEKGPVIAKLAKEGLKTVLLDDNFDNIYNTAKESPDTLLLLMDRPWNQSQDIAPPYRRVKSYQAVLDIVKEELDRATR